MGTKVKVRKISWKSLVEKADPDRRKRKVEYEFSNGRKFYERSKPFYAR